MNITIQKSDDGQHLYIMGMTDLEEVVSFLEIYLKLGWKRITPRDDGFMLSMQ